MQHPWTRYVALGDSFTEGVGDAEPSLPNGFRGWADRVAEELARTQSDFAYANLAIRGRLLGQIMAEQLDAALELQPDLVTISAGGNDILRPGSNPDSIAETFEYVVHRLSQSGATVVLFTAPDVGTTPVLGRVRGKAAIYNCHVHSMALRHGAVIADMWGLHSLQDPRMWSEDRLHFSSLGHHTIAQMVLESLGVEHQLTPMEPEDLPARTWREARIDDIGWAREHLMPWVVRRIRGVSSGDTVSPKRPLAEPFFVPAPSLTIPTGTINSPGDNAASSSDVRSSAADDAN